MKNWNMREAGYGGPMGGRTGCSNTPWARATAKFPLNGWGRRHVVGNLHCHDLSSDGVMLRNVNGRKIMRLGYLLQSSLRRANLKLYRFPSQGTMASCAKAIMVKGTPNALFSAL